MVTNIFSSVFMVLVAGLSLAQTELNGQVVFEGQGVGFATVAIKEIDAVVLADENGYFKFSTVPNSEFFVSASFVGYKPAKKQVLPLTDFVVIELEESENSLGEVVVTGTMRETFVKDSPVKVDVVTSKRMKTYLPSAATSIVENISLVNGVQEVVACGVCYTNEIRINGLPGQYTAILMDGTPIYGNLASVYGLNGIPNQIIDRFEVIKGPSSTLYGSEAVAGVINIITKDPEYEPTLSIDVMGTSHEETFGNISATPRIGNTHGFVGVNYGYVNNFEDRNGDGFGDGVNMDRLSAFTKWNVARNSDKKFSIATKYYFEDRRNGVESFLDDRNYQDLRGNDAIYGESIYTNRGELFGTYEFLTKENIKVDYSLSIHNQDSYYGSDAYDADQKIVFGNLAWNKDIDNHQIVTGATLRFSAYDDNTIATEKLVNGERKNNPSNQFTPGVFVQDEITLTNYLTALAGARLDHYKDHGAIFAPRLSTKLDVGNFTSWRANFGTGFRVVNLFTEDHAFVTGQREVVIAEELHPERSYNVSTSLSHEYANQSGTGNIELDGFYTYFTNKINPNYDIANKIIYENTNGNAQTRGLGVNITHNFTVPLGVNIGASWQKATQKENGETTDVEFAPTFSGVGTMNYQWRNPKITFGYTVNYTGKMQLPEVYDVNNQSGELLLNPRSTESKPFALHDFQAQKQFKKIQLYAGVQNITNFKQEGTPLVGYNDPNSPAGFSQYFDTSYAYAPNHGREAYVGVKWSMQKR